MNSVLYLIIRVLIRAVQKCLEILKVIFFCVCTEIRVPGSDGFLDTGVFVKLQSHMQVVWEIIFFAFWNDLVENYEYFLCLN